MIQVQARASFKIEELLVGLGFKQTVMVMKIYAIGFMGIPVSYWGIRDVIRTMDNFQDWITNQIISPDNFVKACNMILQELGSLHNKNCSESDCAQYILKFINKMNEIVGNLAQNPDYFSPNPYLLMVEQFQLEEQCSICCSQLSIQDIAYLQCKHSFHINCLHQHAKNMIQNGQYIINCPDERCSIEMSNQQLLNFCTPELEKKYYSNQMNRYVEKNGRNTCWCPTPDCQLVFQYDSSISEFNCRRCHQHYCLKCRCVYHRDMSCEEYRSYKGLNPEDQSFVDFARGAKFKQCPKCQFWVQRNKGCPTMICRCKQQFCYQCGGISCPHGTCSNVERLKLR